jgi:formylglycine-generating enzyme required for sulfatase activity
MSVVFVSHSSRDEAPTRALERWLHDTGFDDVFVDHASIAAGDKWREALRQAAGSCRVVLCVVTPNWLASSECFNEFMAAWYMGRRIVPLLLVPTDAPLDEEQRSRLGRVCGEDQGVNLLACIGADDSLDIAANENIAKVLATGLRAAGANTRIGLDPAAFAIDRKIRDFPFPGLASFGDEDADAALFYGRSREIAHVLEDLRQMRALNDLRPLVIQGASGSGKSSLLKAGVIPRLRREAPAWLPLRAFRPGADPLLNFAEALARTFADFGEHEAFGLIRDRLREAWAKAARDSEGHLSQAGLDSIRTTLEAEGKRLRTHANRPGASILISVDQAEEMARAESESSEILADYMRAAFTSKTSHWLLALTIRTDALPELQKHRRFQHLEARGYDLRAVPTFRFESVVEAPAKRYGVQVDVTLVDALMDDAPKEDALPLLAFALQRLWRQYGSSGSLTEAHYRNFGGLSGLVEDASERALRGIDPGQDVPLEQRKTTQSLLGLGLATFVPALVQINDQGATIRRIAAWKSFNEDSQALIDRFESWRILVRKGREERDGGTVEVAHEALFRTWKRLEDWLRPERIRLEALRYLQLDAAAWKRHGRDSAYLNHRDGRLSEAEALAKQPAFAGQIGDDERGYLASCRGEQRRRRLKALGSRGSLAALVALLILGAIGWWQEPWLAEQYAWRAMAPDPLSVAREKEVASQAGRAFGECEGGCPTMVVVPAGSFTMGTLERGAAERPPHEVTIGQSFALGRTEVTVAEWEKCVAAGGCPRVQHSAGTPDLPVANVTWREARQYADWLARMTGKPYRLPNEAEWEYAARAGRKELYPPGGREELNKHAWFESDGAKPVGKLAANGFGLHDMHGNVFELCQDSWHPNYAGNPPLDGSPWPGGEANQRVVRGGGWDSSADSSRVTYRAAQPEGERAPNVGFRVARTLSR